MLLLRRRAARDLSQCTDLGTRIRVLFHALKFILESTGRPNQTFKDITLLHSHFSWNMFSPRCKSYKSRIWTTLCISIKGYIFNVHWENSKPIIFPSTRGSAVKIYLRALHPFSIEPITRIIWKFHWIINFFFPPIVCLTVPRIKRKYRVYGYNFRRRYYYILINELASQRLS